MTWFDVQSYELSPSDREMIRHFATDKTLWPAPLWVRQLFLIEMMQNVDPMYFYTSCGELRADMEELEIQWPYDRAVMEDFQNA